MEMGDCWLTRDKICTVMMRWKWVCNIILIIITEMDIVMYPNCILMMI